MAHVNVSKDINAPTEAVWKVLSNPQRFEEWLTLHTKWKDEPPTELVHGSQITEVVTIMGMANTIEWNVDEFSAPSSMKISGTGLAGAKVTTGDSAVHRLRCGGGARVHRGRTSSGAGGQLPRWVCSPGRGCGGGRRCGRHLPGRLRSEQVGQAGRPGQPV